MSLQEGCIRTTGADVKKEEDLASGVFSRSGLLFDMGVHSRGLQYDYSIDPQSFATSTRMLVTCRCACVYRQIDGEMREGRRCEP